MNYEIDIDSVIADQRNFVNEMNVIQWILPKKLKSFPKCRNIWFNFQKVFMKHCNRSIEVNSFEHVNIVHINSMNEFYASAVSVRHRENQLRHILFQLTDLAF